MARESPRKDRRTSKASLSNTFGNPRLEVQEEIPGMRGKGFGNCNLFGRLVQQLDDLFHRRFREGFSPFFQGFGEADGDVLHVFMRFLGAADQKKFFALGDAPVSIRVIERDSQ